MRHKLSKNNHLPFIAASFDSPCAPYGNHWRCYRKHHATPQIRTCTAFQLVICLPRLHPDGFDFLCTVGSCAMRRR